jgi:hypothetical protein
MANYRYFADAADGSTISFDDRTDSIDHRGKRNGGTFAYDRASNQWVKITRSVEYKAFASKHECDDRCMFAQGRVMKCECACGGKNHGKGRVTFTCEAA